MAFEQSSMARAKPCPSGVLRPSPLYSGIRGGRDARLETDVRLSAVAEQQRVRLMRLVQNRLGVMLHGQLERGQRR